MAFDAGTNWENQTGGADGTTGNGGGFNPTSVNFSASLAATSATGTSPVVTSNYAFLTRDAGHWLYVKSGTNWKPGLYPIVSASAGAATINAAAGAWFDFTTMAPGTTNGCATVASPTAGTFSIDYSQSTPLTFTDMVIDAVDSTKFTSAATPVHIGMIGNVVAVSSGTGWTVQRAQVVSVSAGVGTCDKSLGVITSTGGNGKLGGPLATPGQAGALMVAGNDLYVKSGTYSVTSASSNVASGCLTLPAAASATNVTKMIGYNSIRGDYGTKPLIQASGISTFTLITTGAGNFIGNLSLDGASLTSSRGINMGANHGATYRCKGANFTNQAFLATANIGVFILCEATGCSTVAAMSGGFYFCTSHDNTVIGFSLGGGPCVGNVACNNTGATTDGFGFTNAQMTIVGCFAYGNGRRGFSSVSNQARPVTLINCLAAYNVADGFYDSVAEELFYLINCAVFSNGTDVNANITADRIIDLVTLTADPFAARASNNFALNNAAGGGALLKAAGIPGYVAATQLPGLSTLNYPNIGGLANPPVSYPGMMGGCNG